MQLRPFILERYFARYEFNIQYSLCSSDCESLAIQDLLALEPDASDRFQGHWLGYTESQGSPSLRSEISGLYETISPDQVLVFSGAEEGIFLFMHAALQAGDHIIVHWPCYQSLFEFAHSLGCQVTRWEAREEDGWALDVEELRRSIRVNTKAIVLNTPHNPTGYLMSRDKQREVQTLAQEHGVILFSDEVYRECEYQEGNRLPAGCDLNAEAVSLGVMSKTYGLPGLRIGWIATRNGGLLDRLAMLKDYTTICNSAPSEFLAELALRHRGLIAARNLGIIRRNLQLLDRFFVEYADWVSWQRPKGGTMAFPRLHGREIEKFCKELIQSCGVLLLPGTAYGDHENHFRIGFGRKNMPQALTKLAEFLDSSGDAG